MPNARNTVSDIRTSPGLVRMAGPDFLAFRLRLFTCPGQPFAPVRVRSLCRLRYFWRLAFLDATSCSMSCSSGYTVKSTEITPAEWPHVVRDAELSPGKKSVRRGYSRFRSTRCLTEPATFDRALRESRPRYAFCNGGSSDSYLK